MEESRHISAVLHGREKISSRPGRFATWERTLSTHWIGGWVDPRAGLEAVDKRKNYLASAGNLIPAVQPVARLYTD
jgi:hypothetical protein